ncbi:hypothetical protein D0817_03465 [Flavobacterium cupreum]|uniref:Uncharacterized protein n=1 Tax=Flavobacterium cupreum TaxID=2133766 RepID=A0A434ABN2_9FLAO|nr:hypothetical protein [Flavobacterium cupreum]RUT71756.1 hypothetical protein D0817_03465 [Flavobacterium cupreum]
MKSLFFLCAALLSTIFGSAQSDARYHTHTERIAQFSKPNKLLSSTIDAEGNGSLEYTNPKNQVLRFRLLNHRLQIQHGGIAFQLFSYQNNELQKIENFDLQGKLAGERVSQNEAVTEFIIEKKDEYLKKKKLIDAAEGNIDLADDSQEKIIRVKLFDSKRKPISEKEPSYISSKTYWNYSVRMYWP